MGVTSTRISRFVDLSSMPTLTNLDLEYVCGTTLGTQYLTVPFHIFRKALGYVLLLLPA